MLNKYLIRIIIIILITSSHAAIGICVTPDFVTIEEAISSAKVAAFGRIIRIEETERAQWGTRCSMTMELLEVLKGDLLSQSRTITFEYVCESQVYRILPIQFEVTNLVLVAISDEDQNDNGLFSFDSHVEGGTDHAYIAVGSKADNYLQGKSVVFLDVFLLKSKTTTTRKDLLSFAER
jgi:hypothetical protein